MRTAVAEMLGMISTNSNVVVLLHERNNSQCNNIRFEAKTPMLPYNLGLVEASVWSLFIQHSIPICLPTSSESLLLLLLTQSRARAECCAIVHYPHRWMITFARICDNEHA